jgi:hypothetical protein
MAIWLRQADAARAMDHAAGMVTGRVLRAWPAGPVARVGAVAVLGLPVAAAHRSAPRDLPAMLQQFRPGNLGKAEPSPVR